MTSITRAVLPQAPTTNASAQTDDGVGTGTKVLAISGGALGLGSVVGLVGTAAGASTAKFRFPGASSSINHADDIGVVADGAARVAIGIGGGIASGIGRGFVGGVLGFGGGALLGGVLVARSFD